MILAVATSLTSALPSHAATPYDNATYTHPANDLTSLTATGTGLDGSTLFTGVSNVNLSGSPYFLGDKTQQVNGFSCPLDFVKADFTTNVVQYYRLQYVGGSKGPTIGSLGLPNGMLTPSCLQGNVDPKFNGIAGKAVDAATNPTSPGNDTASNTDEEVCEDNSGFLGWVFCPALNVFNEAINGIYGFALARLDFSLFAPAASGDAGIGGLDSDTYNKVHGSWVFVSRIADILLVLAFLAMIIGQSISGSNLMDAYTVKKLLPRIVIAFILINLSWYIVTFAIEIGNIVGGGVHDIVLFPFKDSQAAKIVVPDNATSAVLKAGILGSIIPAVWVLFKIPQIGLYIVYLLAPIFISLLVALLVGLAFIILRQGILILCAVFAPIAIALWVLPGTTKYFDKWRELLTSMILFYPIFQAVIAIGALLAIVTGTVSGKAGTIHIMEHLHTFFSGIGAHGGQALGSFAAIPSIHLFADNNGVSQLFNFFIAIICFFAPYFMIIQIIRFTGRIPNALAGAMHGKLSGGVGDKISNAMGERRKMTAPSLQHQLKKNEANRRRIGNSLSMMQEGTGVGARYNRTKRKINRLGTRAGGAASAAKGAGVAAGRLARGRVRGDQGAGAALGQASDSWSTAVGSADKAGAMAAARSYQVEDETKRLGKYNAQHLQALASAGMNVQDAEQKLAAAGISYSPGEVQATASALQSQGFNPTNASSLEAIGNLAAGHGMLMQDFAGGINADGSMEKGYYRKTLEQTGDPVASAQAGGTAMAWGLQARGNGQYSHSGGEIAKLDDLAKVSNSDMKPTLARIADQLKERQVKDANGNVVGTAPRQLVDQQITYSDAQGTQHTETVKGFEDAGTQRLLDLVVEAKAKGHLAGGRADALDGFLKLDNLTAQLGGDQVKAQAIINTVNKRAEAAHQNVATGHVPRAA
ncbi:MAG TPA: hypothetical protein VLF60_00920 [Candidatus Saccharimonadales bacterium]|nr:hypothetical protein [Candidatus Saccharimonadales bacterium]